MKSNSVNPKLKLTAIHGGTLVINRNDPEDKYQRARKIREQSSLNSKIYKEYNLIFMKLIELHLFDLNIQHLFR